ncbi:MAG: YlxR family protein [Polyangiaceae bacterium]|nr:YlxR family protein [Polyangiaceae bacterium]
MASERDDAADGVRGEGRRQAATRSPERRAGVRGEGRAAWSATRSPEAPAATRPRPEGAGKARVRTCVGCGERADADAPGLPLVRLILGPGGIVAVDPGDGGFGRGAHVHPRPDCLARAVQRGLPRAAKGRVSGVVLAHQDLGAEDAERPAAMDHGGSIFTEPGGSATPGAAIAGAPAGGIAPLTAASLARAIRQAVDRRVAGLLHAAVRSRGVAIGADAVSGACARGEAELVVVACDAAAGAELPEVRRAIAGGRAAAWGTKRALGVIAGGRRDEGVALLAITSGRIAAAAQEAIRVSDACASAERGAAAPERPGGGTTAQRGRSARSAPVKAPPRAIAKNEDAGVAEPGSTVRDPVVDGAAAKRRPRGWVRRIG